MWHDRLECVAGRHDRQAREIVKIGVFYETADETLLANGFAPNRNGGNQGFPRKPA